MKAVVVEAPNEVSYREVEAPAVGAGDVLVESRQAGLCRTDIELMTGVFTDPRWVRFPVIPGHEWAGTVVDVGANVDSVRVGDRVVCEGFILCHRCRRCRSGETQWCENIEALGFTRPGGYAQLVAVPERVVHRLPDHVSFDAGVLVEPASVVREGELARARQLGATEVVLAGEGAPAEAELDLVVETAGVPVAVVLATQVCRPGGRAVLLGIAGEGRTLTLPSDLLVGKDMSLIGSIAYRASTWSRVVGLVAERVLDLDPIVTHRFPMSDFEEAVRLMDDRRGI